MKHSLFALSLAGLLACTATGPAQEGGTPIKVTTTLHDDGTRTDTIKDVDNRTTETKTYTASQKLLQRCVYTLDAQGREVEGVVYNAKDAILSRMTFQYDAQGNLSEKLEKAPNGMLQRRRVFRRDALGRMSIQAFDAKGNLVKEECSIIAPPTKPESRKK